MKRKRRNHSACFKSRVAVAAIRGDKTSAELSEQPDVHQNQNHDWRRKLLDQADQVVGRGSVFPWIPLRCIQATSYARNQEHSRHTASVAFSNKPILLRIIQAAYNFKQIHELAISIFAVTKFNAGENLLFVDKSRPAIEIRLFTDDAWDTKPYMKNGVAVFEA